MNSEEIKARFGKVSDEVQTNSSQMEQEVRTKVGAIRDETVKKFSGAVSS